MTLKPMAFVLRALKQRNVLKSVKPSIKLAYQLTGRNEQTMLVAVMTGQLRICLDFAIEVEQEKSRKWCKL